ncbi:3-oxoacyl-ACP reductase [Listeria ivanovii]|uniref:Putative oxidoreductase n=1 Tax=Listeria ivanovii (strain ATCC BAA-678 / PAM 55) TaxID=881621 RepID=G2ZAR7_LISIP|nr:3-oxoacyl-ACP reductase [Listeria ivanovii]AHI54956.1 3-ketoacyl-ACP reductase [Listeria ivanovii WSLC3009]AIS64414.1 3-ketoacyl-ACP reductase [Listeria ivanovii subsp. ivanovii]MBC1760203.1 3-oxoacyl-ACP reductase [Listeria ivanovii]MBK3915258.1 3-oxoacyl-ACP reductase [Listeria ivanovii subsp. ivanovii]MBK3922386.1 3-oxoacyl-ACP reductase [Listeria ivanovii subsp. ivanovii]
MIKNKRVFITGTSSGIGLEQTKLFLKEGAVVFGMDIQPTFMEHRNFHFIKGDVRNKEDIKNAVQYASDGGNIEILVHTAGVLDDYKPALEVNETDFDYIMDTNFKSLHYLTQEVLKIMIENRKGIIITMASIAGLVAGGGGAAYTASKHAVIGYTKQLAYDYAAYGIRVNGIAPGAIRTKMNKKDFEGDGEIAQQVADETPVGRWGEAEEVAKVTLFLASEGASYIQGAIIPVDGGWIIK